MGVFFRALHDYQAANQLLAAARYPAIAAVTRLLTFTKEFFVSHRSELSMLRLEMREIDIVIGQADHQTRCLSEISTDLAEITKHKASS